jgi:hypothetical protein
MARTSRKSAKVARKASPTARSSVRKHAGRRSAKPALLAGGNPQIAKAEGGAPVQAYIAAMPGWKRDVGQRLDALVGRTVLGVRKAVKWNSPFYGVEGQGWFLSFHTFTKYVKVAFFRGASLRPVPPGESKHKEVRYLDIHEHQGREDRVRVPTAWLGPTQSADQEFDIVTRKIRLDDIDVLGACVESTTVAEIAGAIIRPVILISPRFINGTASGVMAPRTLWSTRLQT